MKHRNMLMAAYWFVLFFKWSIISSAILQKEKLILEQQKNRVK